MYYKHTCGSCGLLQAFEVKLAAPNESYVQTNQKLQDVLDKHADLFQRKLGKFNGPPVTLHIDERVPPCFSNPCTVPFALKEKIEKELDHLQSLGIIEPVGSPDCSHPQKGWYSPNLRGL